PRHGCSQPPKRATQREILDSPIPSPGIDASSQCRAARHQAKTEMMTAFRRLSMPLVAMCNGGGGRPGVAEKSACHTWSALARSDVGWACLCSTSRERDPLGNSEHSRGSRGGDCLHLPGRYGRV